MGLTEPASASSRRDGGAQQLLVAPLRPQLLELGAQVEHHDRVREAPGRAARPGMHADDEEGLAAEGEREVAVFRVGCQRVVVSLAEECILVGEGLQALPEMALEILLADLAGAFEDDREALKGRAWPGTGR